jgi:hypothetical protein
VMVYITWYGDLYCFRTPLVQHALLAYQEALDREAELALLLEKAKLEEAAALIPLFRRQFDDSLAALAQEKARNSVHDSDDEDDGEDGCIVIGDSQPEHGATDAVGEQVQIFF